MSDPKKNASSIGRKTTNEITYGKCSLWWQSLFFLVNANISFQCYPSSRIITASLPVHQHFKWRKKTVLFTFYVMFHIVNGNWIGSIFFCRDMIAISSHLINRIKSTLNVFACISFDAFYFTCESGYFTTKWMRIELNNSAF